MLEAVEARGDLVDRGCEERPHQGRRKCHLEVSPGNVKIGDLTVAFVVAQAEFLAKRFPGNAGCKGETEVFITCVRTNLSCKKR